MAHRFQVFVVSALLVAANAMTVHNTSDPFIIWNTLDSQCEKKIPGSPLDLPDTPVNAFVDNNGLTHLLSSDTTSRISYGSSLLDNKRNCTIAFNSTNSDDPSMYETNEFLDGSYAFPNGTVYATLHVEYPGMNHDNCPAKITYPYCWTVSLTMAVSHDWGYTWQHARPAPHHMVATAPYQYNASATSLNSGWGDSGGIVRSPMDGYFYTVVHNRFAQGLQSNGSCVLRTKDLTDPQSWRGWDGRDFSVAFVSPYSTDHYNPADHICTVVNIPDCVMLGTVYSVYLKRFVATLTCGEQNGGDSGTFMYSTSEDMVHWEKVQVLYSPPFPPGVHFYSYPKLLDPAAPSRGDINYETIGQSATLTYVSVTHNFYTEGRQIFAVNVTFDISDEL